MTTTIAVKATDIARRDYAVIRIPNPDRTVLISGQPVSVDDRPALDAAIERANGRGLGPWHLEVVEVTVGEAPLMLPTEPGIYTPHPEAPADWRLYRLDAHGVWTRHYSRDLGTITGDEARAKAEKELAEGTRLVRLVPEAD